MTDDPEDAVPGGLFLADGLDGTGPCCPGVRRHYLEPIEVVPLCIAVGTCVPRDEPCIAVRSAEGVDCHECLAALVARSGLPLASPPDGPR